MLTPFLPADGFLDLYAGTGQIGLEAASRGSSPVLLVEKSAPALAAIRTNLAKTRLEDKVTVLAGDIAACLRQLIAQERRFALVFLDPPYLTALNDFTSLAPDLGRLIKPGGLVILEHESRQEPPPFVTNLQLWRSCQYGIAMLSFYKVDQTAGLAANSQVDRLQSAD
ncbi:MAG TPA: 16S rRNA (guanine(966)-N(2))-methyltransferase RsmD [Clostridiales bacterium]|nr:16S rRNA (guanine(966)-N(2))-methyltransferase RsmD [Clostridiales bacterium]